MAEARFDRVVAALKREVARQLEARTPNFNADAAVRAMLTELELQGIETPLQEKRTGKGQEWAEGEIIQVTALNYHGHLFVISGVNAWGVIAYDPGANWYTRLAWGEFARTGGVAPLHVGPTEEASFD